MVTAGAPHDEPLLDLDAPSARAAFSERLTMVQQVARHAYAKVGLVARCSS